LSFIIFEVLRSASTYGADATASSTVSSQTNSMGFAQLVGNIFVVLAVARRQHDAPYAGAETAATFSLTPPTGTTSPQAVLAGHNRIAWHSALGHERSERQEHGNARAGTVLERGACRYVHASIAVFEADGIGLADGLNDVSGQRAACGASRVEPLG
jgi:hypothetical protein